MNDDLNLLLTCYSKDYGMTKIAIRIEHGLNDACWADSWEYFREPDIFKKYKEILPQHAHDLVTEILAVEEIYEIKG